MKTIIIERVMNGWLVRPFSWYPGCGSEHYTGVDCVAVFTSMEDLQAGLPKLMEWPMPVKPVKPVKPV